MASCCRMKAQEDYHVWAKANFNTPTAKLGRLDHNFKKHSKTLSVKGPHFRVAVTEWAKGAGNIGQRGQLPLPFFIGG